MPNLSVAGLAERVAVGSRADVARAITLVESTRPEDREAARQLLRELAPHAGAAIRVGISGSPAWASRRSSTRSGRGSSRSTGIAWGC